MSELFGRVNESTSMDGEVLRAMAGKIVSMGDTLKENTEMTRKLAEQMEVIGELKERVAGQEKQSEELARKEAELAAGIQQAVAASDRLAKKLDHVEVELQKHTELFEKPLDKTVRYHHFLGRSFWILFGAVAVAACALGMMVWQWQRAGLYARDEVKWRFMRLSNDSVVIMTVNRAESDGENDPDGFARSVRAEEVRREELTKNVLREQEARRRIEELEKERVKR